tara:strand:+ start:18401 stop:18595 length:195 start_codon:yes stop_codon:yes gene_type:complete
MARRIPRPGNGLTIGQKRPVSSGFFSKKLTRRKADVIRQKCEAGFCTEDERKQLEAYDKNKEKP